MDRNPHHQVTCYLQGSFWVVPVDPAFLFMHPAIAPEPQATLLPSVLVVYPHLLLRGALKCVKSGCSGQLKQHGEFWCFGMVLASHTDIC